MDEELSRLLGVTSRKRPTENMPDDMAQAYKDAPWPYDLTKLFACPANCHEGWHVEAIEIASRHLEHASSVWDVLRASEEIKMISASLQDMLDHAKGKIVLASSGVSVRENERLSGEGPTSK